MLIKSAIQVTRYAISRYTLESLEVGTNFQDLNPSHPLNSDKPEYCNKRKLFKKCSNVF